MGENSQEMTFWDHLEEFRWTLIRSISALVVFAIAGFAVMPYLFDNVIFAPAKADFFLYKYLCKITTAVPFTPDFCDNTFHVDIINYKLASQFFRHMSTSFWLALILTFPYLMFEIWRFIRPALYELEKKSIRIALVFSTLMFFMGCMLGYSLVFPMTLRFLISYELSTDISNHLSLDSYMDTFLMLIFIMGIVFELPLVSWILSKLGLLNRSFFNTYRRHAVVTLLVAAAIITPSSDPFTLSVVFFPLYFLWELSAFFVKKAPKEEDEDTPSDTDESNLALEEQ